MERLLTLGCPLVPHIHGGQPSQSQGHIRIFTPWAWSHELLTALAGLEEGLDCSLVFWYRPVLGSLHLLWVLPHALLAEHHPEPDEPPPPQTGTFSS